MLIGCLLLTQALCCAKSIQNFGNLFDSPSWNSDPYSINDYRSDLNSVVLPHSSGNFNVYTSALRTSTPVFRPVHGNINPHTNSFHSAPVRRNGQEKPQPGPQTMITFGQLPPEATRSPVRVSNIPIAPFSNRPVVQPERQNIPISFGDQPPSPILSSGPLSNKPRITSHSQSNKPGVNQGSNTELLFPDANEGSETVPDSGNVDYPIISENYTDNCVLEHRQVLFNGECTTFFHQGTCSDGHWLLLSKESKPYCAIRQCPFDQVFYQDGCVALDAHNVCPHGQILYIDFYGNVECDCEENYIFDASSGNCYTRHEQGHCDYSYYIDLDSNNQTICALNPCITDDLVMHEGTCYEKTYQGYCSPSQVGVHKDTNTADCLFLVPYSIFDVPTQSACPPGSRRDYSRRCRAIYRVPTQVSQSTSRGQCQTGFIKDPRGNCRRVVNLFG